MQINEFIDAYSDDIIYLREERQALLTHPLRREIKALCDSSYCRMLAIMMIGGIELMFLEWKEKDKNGILEMWFADKDNTGKKITNGDRVRILYDAFHQAGIAVDKKVFDDFLAIKYLRNTIIHSHWKDYEKEWLEKRGFPTDTRNLTESHWQRMLTINDNMMFYIMLTSIGAKSKGMHQSPKTVRLREASSVEPVGVVRECDLPGIFWLNLERVQEQIEQAIEQAVFTKQYDWTKGLNREAIEKLSDLEKRKMFYKAARKAGEGSLDIFVKHKDFAKEALFSWREYWRLTFNRLQLSRDAIIESTRIIGSLHSKGVYFKGPPLPWNKNMPAEAGSKLIKFLLKGYEPLTEHQIVTALNVGNSVYEIMPNFVPAYVLNVLLPIVDPSKTQVYLDVGNDALVAMELRESWYCYIESKRPSDAESLVLYRELRDIFAKGLQSQ